VWRTLRTRIRAYFPERWETAKSSDMATVVLLE
jgi:hypothetical protein